MYICIYIYIYIIANWFARGFAILWACNRCVFSRKSVWASPPRPPSSPLGVGDDGGGKFSQSIQAPSSTHPGTAYPRANPSLRHIYIYILSTQY